MLKHLKLFSSLFSPIHLHYYFLFLIDIINVIINTYKQKAYGPSNNPNLSIVNDEPKEISAKYL